MSTVNEEKNDVPQDAASQKKESSAKTFHGKIVSVTGNKLIMANKEGKERTHWLTMDAKLTCDGTVCKADDLKAGRKIRVTTKKDNRDEATGVESLDKHTEFAQLN